MSKIINVTVRPHLVSFLFQELEGETQAVYGNKKVKLAKISKASLLGQMIMIFKTRATPIEKKTLKSFGVFLTLENGTERKGLFHEKSYKDYNVLELRSEDVLFINNFLESIFRISLVEFIKGYVKKNNERAYVNRAIEQFMIDHFLYDTEIDPESLKRMYYRSLKKKHSLSRIQNQTSTQSFHYHSA